MKRFYVKLVVFICLLGAILFLIEAAFRLKPNVFRDKFDGVTAKCSDIEIMCLGHSHIEDGVNPDMLLSKQTFNMGFGFENVYFDEYLLNHFIDSLPSLEFVVLSGSCFHLFDELPDLQNMRGENLFHTIKFHLYCKLDKIKSDPIPAFDPVYNLEILNNPPMAYYELVRYYLSSFRSGYDYYGSFYRNGYCPISDRCSEDFLNRDGVWYSSILFGKTDYPFEKSSNYHIYENMARICRQHGIQFIIVLFPAWHTFWENAPNNQYEVTEYLFRNLVSDYDNCRFLDFSHDRDFDAGDFRDATHLNCSGAEKLTKKLDAVISSYYGE